MSKSKRSLTDEEAGVLGLKINHTNKRCGKARYRISDEDYSKVLSIRSEGLESNTKSNEYKNKDKFVLSAWNKDDGQMMDIDMYCSYYNLPKKDVASYKLVSHTGTPFYNIVFNENINSNPVEFDLEGIISKHINPVKIEVKKVVREKDFDTLTYTDVHIGMETNPDKNSMYPVEWNKEVVINYARNVVETTIQEKQSPVLIIDELGDFLDGLEVRQ